MGVGDAPVGGFEDVLTEHVYRAAWRYAWHLRPVYEDAQDLLQEALAHAWLRFHQLRDQRRFKGWLLSIVRTRFLMARRRRALPVTGDGLPLQEAGAGGSHTAGRYAGLPPALASGMLRLPAAQREAVELHYLQELSIEEVAGVLGIRPGTVKVRLHRARQRLKRALAADVSGQLSRAERGD